MSQPIAPALALTIHDPEWFSKLSPAERVVWAWYWSLWFRPEQYVPQHHWSTCGYDGGRGWGKSLLISAEINRRIAAKQERLIALMAPTEDRVEEVQIRALIATALPWETPVRWKGGLRWPNGTIAVAFTPEAPGRTRSENISLSWLCELVDWKPSTRLEAYENISTATRVGKAQLFWDSTSKGRSDVLEKLRADNAVDPYHHPIIGGTMFQNPMLSRQYLRHQWSLYAGVRREEELFGRHFSEAQGALWKQAWLDEHRVDVAPPLRVRMVAIDPAQSTHSSSDETGIMVGGSAADDHAYVTSDLSGKYPPEEWGDIAVRELPAGGRATIERNHLGDNAVYVLRSRAANAGLTVRTIGRHDEWPEAEEGVIHVREQVSRESKGTRADGPAAETEAGRVHLVGEFPELEKEMTTYVPGQRRSPNRLDAAAFLITELRGLGREVDPADAEADMRAAAAAHAILTGAIRTPARVGTLAGPMIVRPRLGL